MSTELTAEEAWEASISANKSYLEETGRGNGGTELDILDCAVFIHSGMTEEVTEHPVLLPDVRGVVPAELMSKSRPTISCAAHSHLSPSPSPEYSR